MVYSVIDAFMANRMSYNNHHKVSTYDGALVSIGLSDSTAGLTGSTGLLSPLLVLAAAVSLAGLLSPFVADVLALLAL